MGGTFDNVSGGLLVCVSTPVFGLVGKRGRVGCCLLSAYYWVLKAQAFCRCVWWGCWSSGHAHGTCCSWGWYRLYVENYTVDASIFADRKAFMTFCGVVGVVRENSLFIGSHARLCVCF